MLRTTLVLGAMLTVAGCGGGHRSSAPPARPPLTAVQAHPPAPEVAGTLARVPDSVAARSRLGYADRGAAPQVVAAVLGRGAPKGAVRVGARAVRPEAEAPARNVLQNEAVSTAQSCLGEPVAQTIVGPERMGHDAALGVALAPSDRGMSLRICGAPHYHRDLAAVARAFRARFGARATLTELGERAIVTGSVPVDEVSADQLTRLLRGGPALRSLGWR